MGPQNRWRNNLPKVTTQQAKQMDDFAEA